MWGILGILPINILINRIIKGLWVRVYLIKRQGLMNNRAWVQIK